MMAMFRDCACCSDNRVEGARRSISWSELEAARASGEGGSSFAESGDGCLILLT